MIRRSEETAWETLGEADVGVSSDEDRLLAAIQERAPGSYASRVRVLAEHPFFFEHALDHLPGTYLLEVGRQLALASARRFAGLEDGAAAVARRFSVRFAGFAEKREDIEVTAAVTGEPGELAVSFAGTQSARVLGEASSVWSIVGPARPRPLPAERPASAPLEDPSRVPVTRELVHKQHDENVLLEWVAALGADGPFSALVRALPDHAFFRPRREGFLGGLYLIEAARQLGEAVSHAFLGVPLDRAFVIEAMDVRLPARAFLGDAVLLSARALELERRQGEARRMRFGFEASQAGRTVLSAEASWRVLPREVYRRIRGLS